MIDFGFDPDVFALANPDACSNREIATALGVAVINANEQSVLFSVRDNEPQTVARSVLQDGATRLDGLVARAYAGILALADDL